VTGEAGKCRRITVVFADSDKVVSGRVMSGEADTCDRNDELDRLDLYRYVTADDPAVRAQYIAIMGLSPTRC
jgi:hypothetical protein